MCVAEWEADNIPRPEFVESRLIFFPFTVRFANDGSITSSANKQNKSCGESLIPVCARGAGELALDQRKRVSPLPALIVYIIPYLLDYMPPFLHRSSAKKKGGAFTRCMRWAQIWARPGRHTVK